MMGETERKRPMEDRDLLDDLILSEQSCAESSGEYALRASSESFQKTFSFLFEEEQRMTAALLKESKNRGWETPQPAGEGETGKLCLRLEDQMKAL